MQAASEDGDLNMQEAPRIHHYCRTERCRKHDLAKATGTTIVISHDGVIEHVKPKLQDSSMPE
jgi:hypothetical protein